MPPPGSQQGSSPPKLSISSSACVTNSATNSMPAHNSNSLLNTVEKAANDCRNTNYQQSLQPTSSNLGSSSNLENSPFKTVNFGGSDSAKPIKRQPSKSSTSSPSKDSTWSKDTDPFSNPNLISTHDRRPFNASTPPSSSSPSTSTNPPVFNSNIQQTAFESQPLVQKRRTTLPLITPPPRNLIDRLREFSLFESAPESFLNEIASKLRPLHVSAQEFIITEGDEARAMYWILRGSVGIVSLDGESVHAELGPGAFFGEIGILFDRPRTASVQTRTRCLLVVLTADALNEVLPSYPDIEQLIRDEAQERLAILEKNRQAKQDEAHSASSKGSQSNDGTSSSASAESKPLETISASLSSKALNSSTSIKELSDESQPQDASRPLSSSSSSSLSETLLKREKIRISGSPSPGPLAQHALKKSPDPFSETERVTPMFPGRRTSIGDNIYLESTRVRQLLEEIQLFASLPSAIIHNLALSIEPQSFAPFQDIIKQGKPGKDIYFLLDGKVEVVDETSKCTLARLTRGAYFGEMGFLSLAPVRTATVRTITEVDCLVLPEKALDTLRENHPEIQQNIKKTAQQRIDTNTSQQIWTTEGVHSLSPSAVETLDSLQLHKNRNRHSSISTSSSSEHGNSGIDLMVKPLDLDPFSVPRGERNDSEDQTNSSGAGVGLFSKSWNTTGAFDMALKPPELEEPLDPMDPRQMEIDRDLGSDSSSMFKSNFANDSVAFKQVNFGSSRRTSVATQDPLPNTSKQSSTTPPPASAVASSSSSSASAVSSGSLFKPGLLDPNSSETQGPLQNQTASLDIAPDQMPPLSQHPQLQLQHASHASQQPRHISSPFTVPSFSTNSQFPRRSKSVSMVSGTNMVPPEPEGRKPSVDPGLDFLQDRRRQFSQAIPSMPGLGGMLLHPRVKRVRYSGRRRSSLFNVGPFPDHLQIRVFQHLGIKDLMRLRRVCQHWRQVLQTSTQLMKVMDLSQYNTTITDKSIIPITNFAGTRPKIVDISNCFHLTDEGFSYLVNGIGLAKIEVFKMKSVWEVSSMAIMDITVPSIGSDLQEIDLSNCRKVGDDTLSRLVGWVVPPRHPSTTNPHEPQMMQGATVVGCQNLRRISVSYCKRITDRSMYHMAMFASDRLESLNLTRCTSITDHGFSYWGMRQFTALTHLCLADCTFLTDKAIMSITSAAKNLESLVLSFCCALTDVSVEVLALGCPALRSLDLAFCGSAVSDSSLTSIALHLFELERLSVRGCIRVTNTGINLLLADSQKLQYLDITQCRNVVPPLNVPPISFQPPPPSVINGSHFSHTAHPAPILKSLEKQTKDQLRLQVEVHAHAAEAKAFSEAQAQAAQAQAEQYNNYVEMPMHSDYYHQPMQHQLIPSQMMSPHAMAGKPCDIQNRKDSASGHGQAPTIEANNGSCISGMKKYMNHPLHPQQQQQQQQSQPIMNQIVPLGAPGTPSIPVPTTATDADIANTMSAMSDIQNIQPQSAVPSLQHGLMQPPSHNHSPYQYPVVTTMDSELPAQEETRPFVFIKMN